MKRAAALEILNHGTLRDEFISVALEECSRSLIEYGLIGQLSERYGDYIVYKFMADYQRLYIEDIKGHKFYKVIEVILTPAYEFQRKFMDKFWEIKVVNQGV